MTARCTAWLATALSLVCMASSLAADRSGAEALKALCHRLEIGPGAASADTGDPVLRSRLDAKAVVRVLPLGDPEGSTVLFFGLDRGRAVLPALKHGLRPSTQLVDVVLDEWALTPDELPSGGPHPGVEVLRKNKDGLALPPGMRLGLVLFVDADHRLWEPLPLLRQLRERMPDSGRLAIVERQGPDDEPRRLAGHRRHFSSRLAAQELREADFRLQQTLAAPTEDRYFALFDRTPPREAVQPKNPDSPKP